MFLPKATQVTDSYRFVLHLGMIYNSDLTGRCTFHDTRVERMGPWIALLCDYAAPSLPCQINTLKKSFGFPERYHRINTKFILWSEEQCSVLELSVGFTEFVDIRLREEN